MLGSDLKTHIRLALSSLGREPIISKRLRIAELKTLLSNLRREQIARGILRPEPNAAPKMWGVYLCGPTDCFLHAAFVREEDAHAWMQTRRLNPEGGIVKQISLAEMSRDLEDEEAES